MLSVLFPTKGWFGADQPWTVAVRPPEGQAVALVMTDFAGSSLDPAPGVAREFAAEGQADLRTLFPAMRTAGTYLLYAVPKDQVSPANFVGTPLVVSVREDRRRGAPPGPMVVKVDPLRYAILETDHGDMTVAFYLDVAPVTIDNFVRLATEKFYDGLTFHRVDPEFVAQAGDPRGDGTGGPGYTIDAEFSDRKHDVGVVSMARNVDPNEAPNNPPRPEFANSAGSQFFVCVDAKAAANLNGSYTVFGKVVGPAGIKTLKAIGATPVADKKTGRPEKAPVILRVEVRPVTAKENPYRVLLAPARERE
ncbi:MAG TPA: peptidylprolyl isomerase [Tepidisphaeraceae bacterium]|nr:peptidylprolyl isomerase [Tepidisphaeraceae bacterium]